MVKKMGSTYTITNTFILLESKLKTNVIICITWHLNDMKYSKKSVKKKIFFINTNSLVIANLPLASLLCWVIQVSLQSHQKEYKCVV